MTHSLYLEKRSSCVSLSTTQTQAPYRVCADTGGGVGGVKKTYMCSRARSHEAHSGWREASGSGGLASAVHLRRERVKVCA